MQVVTPDLDHKSEMTIRITLVLCTFNRYVWNMNSTFSVLFNRKVYSSHILPILTHEAEAWRLTKSVRLKLRTTQQAMERKIIGVTLRDRKRSSSRDKHALMIS